MRRPITRIMILMLMAAFVLSVMPTPVKAATVPGAPIGFTAISEDGTVTLAWSEPEDDGGSAITSYRVYRGIMVDGLGIVEDVTDIQYTDTGLSNGQTYYYAVSALNAEGEGEKTMVLSVILEASPLLTLIYVEDYTTVVIINVGEGVYFDIAGGRHNVIVESITGSNALITVSPDSKSLTLKEGDSKKVDVNDDDADDFVITCKTINSVAQTVEFSFTKTSKESAGGIPGFGSLALIVGSVMTIYVYHFKRVKSTNANDMFL